MEPIVHPDLKAVLNLYGVQVRAYGSGWRKILCPSREHPETNPSCTVNFDLGKIFCHGCGFKGDGLDLVRINEGLTLANAIDFLRERGIGESDGTVQRGPARKPRDGVSGQARNRATNRRDVEARLRRPAGPHP